MKILLIGHTGFVGSNVYNELKKDMDLVTYSKSTGMDLLNLESTIEILKSENPDVIVNCAAKVGSLNYVTKIAADILDENMRMLLNLFKAINITNPKVILINPVANCAFPGNQKEYYEDELWDGRVHQSVLAYGSTRRMIDVMSDCYKMQYGIKSISLYVPNMYGPFDSTDPNKAHALNALVSKIVKAKKEYSESIDVWGSGIAIREWLYAPDFGKVIRLIIESISIKNYSEPFNIAQQYGLSIGDLLNIIIKEANFNGEVIWDKSMPDGALKKVMNDSRFRKNFPDFEFTTLDDGLKNTIDYYESIYPY
jgi:GDP-L-fucose synthase